MKRSEAAGLSLIIVAGILWGTIGVVSRWLTEDGFSPISISTFRFLIAASILLIWALTVYGPRGLFMLPRRDALLILSNGVMLAISQTSYLVAIPLAGVTISTLIIICAAPLIVAAFATFVRRERLDRRILFALLSSVLGTALLVGVPSQAGSADLTSGVFFSFVSALSYAAVIQIGHSLTRRHEPLRINAVSFSIGALLLLAVSVPAGLKAPSAPHDWALVAYLGVFPSVTAYALFLRGMRAASATVSGILVLLEPLVAALLAAAIFGERLSPLGLIGGLLMCTGFALVIRRR